MKNFVCESELKKQSRNREYKYPLGKAKGAIGILAKQAEMMCSNIKSAVANLSWIVKAHFACHASLPIQERWADR